MPEFSVSDVMCDSAHFSASSQHGSLEGSGIFRQSESGTGGLISGTVKSGPARFLNCPINIRVEGDSGVCYIP